MKKIIFGTLSVFTIFLNSVYSNIPPYITSHINTLSMNEDDTLKLIMPHFFADSDGVIIRYSITLPAQVPISVHDSIITLKPDKDFYGVLSGIAVAVDDSGDSVVDNFMLTIKNVNDPPQFINSIHDTSITNNTTDSINLEPYIYDIDNEKNDLSFIINPINGIKITINHFTLKVTPVSFIDTAHIRLIVKDPEGLSDTAGFKLFTNKATPLGTHFYLGGTRISTSFSTIKSIRTADSVFYLDTYNDAGQKMEIPRKLPIPPLASGDSYTFYQIDEKTYLYKSIGFSSVKKYLFLDSLFNIATEYPFSQSIYPEVGKCNGKIFLAGRTENGLNSFYIDVFDTNFTLLRVDTIYTKTIQSSVSSIVFNKNTYSVFWRERSVSKMSDSMYSQLYGKSFAIGNGTVTVPGKPLLPYIKADTALPVNALRTVSICRTTDSSGYVILWSFDNEKKIDESTMQTWPNTKVYGLQFNTDLQPLEKYKVLFEDTSKGGSDTKDMRVMSIIALKKNYFITFSVGYYSLVYYYGFYNSSFSPVSRIVAESPTCFNGPNNYTLLNDTTVFRVENCNTGGPFGTYLKINTYPQTASKEQFTRHPECCSSKSPVKIVHDKFEMHIICPGTIKAELYTLNGRTVFSKAAEDVLDFDLSSFGNAALAIVLHTKYGIYRKIQPCIQ